MKILFCGLGSIGERQARLLKEHFPEHDIFALRSYQGQAKKKNTLNIPELNSWEEVDRHEFQVAFITNPTHLHITTALECAKRKMHLFLEKPIDVEATRLPELLEAVSRNQLTTYVAYPLRFHPLIQKLKKALDGEKILHARAVCASYLPDWRPQQNHLESYSAHRSQGGGVILDISHEMDLATHLFGDIQSLSGTFGKKSQVTVDAEDYADLILTHETHATNVHLNYFSRHPERYMAVDTEESFFQADLLNATWTQVRRGEDPVVEKIDVERDDLYREQLTYFFENLTNPCMQNNLPEAAQLFEKLIHFRQS